MLIVLLLGFGALLFVPAIAWRHAAGDPLTVATENGVRYRTAALVCFSFAVLIYTIIAVIRMSPVAWWLVGCAMVPFAAYYARRRTQLDHVD